MKHWARKRARASLATAVVVGGALTGTAFALGLVGQTDPIVACAMKTTGHLRQVADASACRSVERSVTWNVQGPPGPAGTTLVERWTLLATQPLPGGNAVTTLALTGGSWQQQSDALNVLYASVDIKAPAVCTNVFDPRPGAAFIVEIVVDGDVVGGGAQGFLAPSEETTYTLSSHLTSDVSGTHTAELRVHNECAEAGQTAQATRAALDITSTG